MAQLDAALPEPPRQHAPWTPSAGAPARLADAAGELFDQGLADPRDCEYRAIRLRVRFVSGGQRLVTTHGWVFASTFAVAWNGLVYPIESDPPTDEPAELAADVAAMLDHDVEVRRRHAIDRPDAPFYRHRNAWSEDVATATTSLLPLRAALLLRLGDAAAAARLWSAWHVGMNASTNDDAAHLADPYLLLATDWTWALFDRAVTAHMHADDELALASASQLAQIRPRVNQSAARRGFPTGERPPDRHLDYLPFLGPLDALLADQRRRQVTAPPGSAASVAASIPASAFASTPPSVSASIPALIAGLEDVRERQDSQPGGVDLLCDSRVTALVAAGDAAVEPLLEVLAHDTRLTRAVSFHRDFHRHRHVHGVHEAAYAALTQLVGTATLLERPGELATLDGRRALAGELRQFHAAHRGHTFEERAFAVLLDDSATPERWLEAAELIAPPPPPVDGWEAPPEPPALPARAERLRDRDDPSVTELLARRLRELAADGRSFGSPAYRTDVVHARRMSAALGRWDPRGARDTLRSEVARAMRLFDELTTRDDFDHPEHLGLAIADLTSALVRGGDDDALPRFTAWLRRITPGPLGSLITSTFAPLAQHAQAPAVDAFLRWAFHDPSSPYLPVVAITDGRVGRPHVDALLCTDLLYARPFRDRALADLADRRPFAELHACAAGRVQIPGFVEYVANDDYAPAAGARIPVRYCDAVGWQITSWGRPRDAPVVELHWPLEQRDHALAELRAYFARLAVATP